MPCVPDHPVARFVKAGMRTTRSLPLAERHIVKPLKARYFYRRSRRQFLFAMTEALTDNTTNLGRGNSHAASTITDCIAFLRGDSASFKFQSRSASALRDARRREPA